MLKKIIFLFAISNFTNASEFLVVQSTTSTSDSGLYDFLLPIYEKKTGIDVRVVAVGTGQAIKNAKNGDGDLLIVHSEEDEKDFVLKGYGVERKEFMYNDFIIIGPKSDPENLKAKNSIKDVFNTIKIKNLPFLTRGDNSGTHKKEVSLWKSAQIETSKLDQKYYIDAGRGMGATLNMAASMDAYTITDRGTWLSFNNKQDLGVLFSGVPPLHNQYSVIVINPEKHPHVKYELANNLSNWLISDEGQQLISKYKIMGQQLFFPNSSK
jgi:tungstate transport system substrate-binding protein